MQHSEESDPRPLRERITYPPSQIEEIYPYDDWFDGSVWRLKIYEDFWVQPKSMQSALYQAARKRKLKVKTHIPTTGEFIYIQVVNT